MLASTLAMAVCPLDWSAMNDEAVDMRQRSTMAGAKFVYDILRFAQ
jgi:hypothetical protein